MDHARSIYIGEPRAVRSDRGWRVEADVHGHPLWFESPDIELNPAPEAFVCAALPMAAALELPLVAASALDAKLLTNVEQVLETWRGWWGYPRNPRAILSGLIADHATAADRQTHNARGIGLCFSMGVDSFYSLLRGDARVDTIVHAHGYDMAVDDDLRTRAAEQSLRALGTALGMRAVIIRTNLRQHPLWTRKPWHWGKIQIGPLVALGCVLGTSLRELRISASFPKDRAEPWGSHWTTDALWSTRWLDITHVGTEMWRGKKLLEIMHEPLVRAHLRVCNRKGASKGNCGACEKCVRTRLILHAAGELDGYTAFPANLPLAQSVEQLRKLKPPLLPVYRAILATQLAPDVSRAVKRLLVRSGGLGLRRYLKNLRNALRRYRTRITGR